MTEARPPLLTLFASSLAFMLLMGGIFALPVGLGGNPSILAVSAAAIASSVGAFLLRKSRPRLGFAAMLVVVGWIYVLLETSTH